MARFCRIHRSAGEEHEVCMGDSRGERTTEGRSQTPLTIATDRVPIGPWSKDPREKEIGKYNLLNLMEGMVRTCPPPPHTRKARGRLIESKMRNRMVSQRHF